MPAWVQIPPLSIFECAESYTLPVMDSPEAVSIAAFQAENPGSTPGPRVLFKGTARATRFVQGAREEALNFCSVRAGGKETPKKEKRGSHGT